MPRFNKKKRIEAKTGDGASQKQKAAHRKKKKAEKGVPSSGRKGRKHLRRMQSG